MDPPHVACSLTASCTTTHPHHMLLPICLLPAPLPPTMSQEVGHLYTLAVDPTLGS